MCGKATETAIAAIGLLAERYDGGTTKFSAAKIAALRGLRRPFASKVLTDLARAGLVVGVRGPGGGFTLAREPAAIRLAEVHTLFEGPEAGTCPCGGLCRLGRSCPLQRAFATVRQLTEEILERTTFAVFQKERSETR